MHRLSNQSPLAALEVRELQLDDPARIQTFDQLRGLLLFWMILGHAFHLTHAPADFPLNYLRLGAVTDNFVMLTGFVIGWIFTQRPVTGRQTMQLFRRAATIFAVAYASNLAFALARDFSEGAASLDNLLQMATFQRAWTISAILVATAATIIVSAALLPCRERIGAARLLIVTTLTWILLHTCRALQLPPATWADQVLNQTIFATALIDLTVVAAWAFSLAAWLRERRTKPQLWAAVILASLVAYMLCRAQLVAPPIAAILRSPAQFTVSLWLVALLAAAAPSIGAVLGLIGRHSLFVFLLHRVVLHAALPLTAQFAVGAAATWTLVLVTTATCVLAAYAIERLKSRQTTDEFAPATGKAPQLSTA